MAGHCLRTPFRQARRDTAADTSHRAGPFPLLEVVWACEGVACYIESAGPVDRLDRAAVAIDDQALRLDYGGGLPDVVVELNTGPLKRSRGQPGWAGPTDVAQSASGIDPRELQAGFACRPSIQIVSVPPNSRLDEADHLAR